MNFKAWFSSRGPKFVRLRTIRIMKRYDLFPTRAMDRIRGCVKALSTLGCLPTFPTPGIIVQRYPKYFRELQENGVEIAVHGFQHVDLKTYSKDEAHNQLVRAITAFHQNQIEVHGFRCPYLGFKEDMLNAIPKGLFEYSSNKSLDWNVLTRVDHCQNNPIFKTLSDFYRALPASEYLSVPWTYPNLLEIPISMPDDLQLLDGLNYSPDEISAVWIKLLNITYDRGELFNLIFHPELAGVIEPAFHDVLVEARSRNPKVWIARLCDISNWWSDKDKFKTNIRKSPTGSVIEFACSKRTSILVKNLDINCSGQNWDGNYKLFTGSLLEINGNYLPLIGVSADAPESTICFLRDQGYIVDLSDEPHSCSIYLSKSTIEEFQNNVKLLSFIEEQNVPLVRYWRWPDGARSAMSVTGDLDALSLMDYFSRIYIS
jgi:peptidoglycan/xylan/chitin deacetylase (PgdA/CDA1 family)